jgi:hypothetical protein
MVLLATTTQIYKKSTFRTQYNNMRLGGFRVDPRVEFTLNNWDGQTLCPRTDCFKPYNTWYVVKYTLFAQFLTPIGAQNPLIY